MLRSIRNYTDSQICLGHGHAQGETVVFMSRRFSRSQTPNEYLKLKNSARHYVLGGSAFSSLSAPTKFFFIVAVNCS